MNGTLQAILDLLTRIGAALGITPAPTPPPVTPSPPPVLPVTPPPPPPPVTPTHLFPAGNVMTKARNGQPYGTPWSWIARWHPDVAVAVAELKAPFDPLLLECFMLVESQGKHYVGNGMTGPDSAVIHGNADYRSRGMLQIRHDLHDPQMKALQPKEHIRLGVKLLASWMKAEGGVWEAALIKHWHPGTDPASGVNQQAYIRIVRDCIAEAKMARQFYPFE